MRDHVLYDSDLRSVDLTLFQHRLERIIRTVHTDHLQLDQKAKKAALVVSPLTPTKILELTLSILFNHYSLPPSITLLTRPSMTCVGAGIRTGLVVDIGWEETVVTAVAEFKTIFERRSIRGGKMLTEALTTLLRDEAAKLPSDPVVDFALVDEVKDRIAWVRPIAWARPAGVSTSPPDTRVRVPLTQDTALEIDRQAIAEVVEQNFFSSANGPDTTILADDNDSSLPALAHDVLRRLPGDVRAACAERIVVDGSQSNIPGLRSKLIRQIQSLVDTRGWDIVEYSGSAKAPNLYGKPSNSVEEDTTQSPQPGTGPVRIRDLPIHGRPHDDRKDHVTIKAERELNKQRVIPFSGKVRGIESLGAWAGASMVLAMKVKGTCEVERDDFLKHGLRESVSLLI